MFENVGRKVFFAVLALLVALGFLLFKNPAFRLGLDLEGGTRLVYRLDFDNAIKDGSISDFELQDRGQLLAETITIIRNRVDPQGVLEPVIRPEGNDRIVIELPGTFDLQGDPIRSTSQNALGESEQELTLSGGEIENFPASGGLIQIDDEIIRYSRRDGSTLLFALADRKQRNTNIAPHDAGATVELVSDDAIRSRIESLGDLSFQIVANASDLQELGTDLAAERTRLSEWMANNPTLDLTAFNRVPRDAGGPPESIQWFPNKQDPERPPTTELERAEAVLKGVGDNSFRGADLSKVYPTQDSLGYPAVGFEMRIERKGDFGDFTENSLNRRMAIILNDEIASAPSIDERLPGAGIIRGRFTNEEVRDLMTILRSGSLKIAPVLEYEEIVGPTLGADYVSRGFLSALVAIGLVLLFMALYYRRLGVFAAISLVVNLTLLLGGLSFLDATLTLPGIAGIILTVGMAVDANILIFDRVREEADKGRNAKQATKTGFEKALSAILDANITTFLTAVILYKIGTGPVRGFAVTLMVGIISSVFCALLVTRLLVHWSLTRDTKRFEVGKWMVTASYDFLGKAKLAMAGSALATLSGLVLFISQPEQEKLGIDFTGGAEIHLRTEAPQSIATMRERVAKIPGSIGDSAEVKPILNSGSEASGYTDFRAIFKTLEEEPGDFEGEIKAALADLLLKDGVQVDLRDEGGVQKALLRLLFEEPHPTSDLEGDLGKAGLSSISVQLDESRDNAYVASAEASTGQSASDVHAQVRSLFRDATDSNGNPYRLATPVPSSSLVGPQVVGELRDKALLALAISLFVTVMYIRVRFAEYSYGFAAVAAVVHDVLITLGVLALVNHLGLLNGEISLPMIAAFLTIVGYSLNDTIVIFDRVRENLPRTKGSFRDVLNLSINQTLSRTVLTSITTFMAVLCLFVFNYGTGNVLESFSFAMMVGVLTGTYSTIFIANPVLHWLETRQGGSPAVTRPQPSQAPAHQS